jgi:hypothetical protein
MISYDMLYLSGVAISTYQSEPLHCTSSRATHQDDAKSGFPALVILACDKSDVKIIKDRDLHGFNQSHILHGAGILSYIWTLFWG